MEDKVAKMAETIRKMENEYVSSRCDPDQTNPRLKSETRDPDWPQSPRRRARSCVDASDLRGAVGDDGEEALDCKSGRSASVADVGIIPPDDEKQEN